MLKRVDQLFRVEGTDFHSPSMTDPVMFSASVGQGRFHWGNTGDATCTGSRYIV